MDILTIATFALAGLVVLYGVALLAVAGKWRAWMWQTSLMLIFWVVAGTILGWLLNAAFTGFIVGSLVFIGWSFVVYVLHVWLITYANGLDPNAFVFFSAPLRAILWDRRGQLWNERMLAIKSIIDGHPPECAARLHQIGKWDYPNQSFLTTNELIKLMSVRAAGDFEKTAQYCHAIIDDNTSFFVREAYMVLARTSLELGEPRHTIDSLNSIAGVQRKVPEVPSGFQDVAGMALEYVSIVGLTKSFDDNLIKASQVTGLYANFGCEQEFRAGMREMKLNPDLVEVNAEKPTVNDPGILIWRGLIEAANSNTESAQQRFQQAREILTKHFPSSAATWIKNVFNNSLDRAVAQTADPEYGKTIQQLRPQFLRAMEALRLGIMTQPKLVVQPVKTKPVSKLAMAGLAILYVAVSIGAFVTIFGSRAARYQEELAKLPPLDRFGRELTVASDAKYFGELSGRLDKALRASPSTQTFALTYMRGLADQEILKISNYTDDSNPNFDGAAKRAIDSFSEVVRQAPNFANAYFHRAEVYEQLGQHKEALQDSQNALNLLPEDERLKNMVKESGRLSKTGR